MDFVPHWTVTDLFSSFLSPTQVQHDKIRSNAGNLCARYTTCTHNNIVSKRQLCHWKRDARGVGSSVSLFLHAVDEVWYSVMASAPASGRTDARHALPIHSMCRVYAAKARRQGRIHMLVLSAPTRLQDSQCMDFVVLVPQQRVCIILRELRR